MGTKNSLILLLVVAFILLLVSVLFLYPYPYYFIGRDDVARHLEFTEPIIEHSETTYTYLPGFHILISIISMITGIDFVWITKTMPYLIFLFTILLSYIFVKRASNHTSAIFSAAFLLLYNFIEPWYLWDGAYPRMMANLLFLLCLLFINMGNIPFAFLTIFAIGITHMNFFLYCFILLVIAFANFPSITRKWKELSANYRLAVASLTVITPVVVIFVTQYRIVAEVIDILVSIFSSPSSIPIVNQPWLLITEIPKMVFQFSISYIQRMALIYFLASIGVISYLKKRDRMPPLLIWFLILLPIAVFVPIIGAPQFVIDRLGRETAFPATLIAGVVLGEIIFPRITKFYQKQKSKMLFTTAILTLFTITVFIYPIVIFNLNLIIVLPITFVTMAFLTVLRNSRFKGNPITPKIVVISFSILIFSFSSYSAFSTYIRSPIICDFHRSDYVGMNWLSSFSPTNSLTYGYRGHMVTPWIPVFTEGSSYSVWNLSMLDTNLGFMAYYLLLGSYTHSEYIFEGFTRYVLRESHDNTTSLVKIYDNGECDIYYLIP
ncbi:MAG: hypothetical protein ACFE7I_00810 [Candidatus Hodarchaeota archaeon]